MFYRLDGGHAETSGTIKEGAPRDGRRGRCDRPCVILTHEHNGKLPGDGEIQRFEQHTLVHGPFAEESYGNLARTQFPLAIPVFSLGKQDGERIIGLVGRGPVVARVLFGGVRKAAIGQNVFGIKKRTRDPGRYFIVGAHYGFVGRPAGVLRYPYA